VKLHLARALIMNPELMVMHRPLYHFDEDIGRKILNLVKIHHKNRGLCMPTTTMGRRRPRTVFMSIDDGHEWQENAADIVWRIDEIKKTITERKAKHPDSEYADNPEWLASKGKGKGSDDDDEVQEDARRERDRKAMMANNSWRMDISDWCASPRQGQGIPISRDAR